MIAALADRDYVVNCHSLVMFASELFAAGSAVESAIAYPKLLYKGAAIKMEFTPLSYGVKCLVGHHYPFTRHPYPAWDSILEF
ncbi:hypothetical protein NTE_02566 [Candidatus Nitrososphaera evergladensis SR1]|uniref:Uncharacterized protein n=1 Tax=Candidatus Nitrososphaera evergladensis SR1 TaxID=1459636 RepID=A0A075MTU5_9ARCH|nr:hypothetical protein NTE_02566 [Candidatus Nitrososphaera evergladensis SR1]